MWSGQIDLSLLPDSVSVSTVRPPSSPWRLSPRAVKRVSMPLRSVTRIEVPRRGYAQAGLAVGTVLDIAIIIALLSTRESRFSPTHTVPSR